VEVQLNGVIDTQAKQHTHKLEHYWCFERVPIKPEVPTVVFVHKHPEVGVKYLSCDQLEILLLNTSLVMAFFADKGDFQRFL
jgi:hypothetical protein